MEKSKGIFESIMKVFEFLATVTLALMTILISLQVLFRYVLNSPLAWTEELARYTFIWMTFIAGFVAAVRGEHVAITMLQDKFKGYARATIVFIANTITSVFFMLVGYYSVSQWEKLSMQTSPVLKIPMSYVYLGIIIGSVCMAIWYLYSGIRAFLNAKKEKPHDNSVVSVD